MSHLRTGSCTNETHATCTDRDQGWELFESELLDQLDALLHVAIRFTGERADAEDLVSDTVLRALERRSQYQLGTNVRAWLITILYRLFVDRQRRMRRHEVRLVESECDRALFLPVGKDPEQCIYDALLGEEIAGVLGDLPAHYRLPVVLREVDDLSYGQIADLLGIPAGTVKSRVFRARRLLRRKLGGYAAEMGYVRGAAAA